MPIYEYICETCNKDFETLVLSSTKEVKCVYCEGDKIKKKFSAFAMKSDGKIKNSKSCGSCSTHNCGNCSCH